MSGKSITVRNYHSEIPGEMVDNTWLFPIVTSVNAHGRKTNWRAKVNVVECAGKSDDTESYKILPFLTSYMDNLSLPDNICAMIKIDSWLEDGAVRKSVPTIVKEGKNKGKSHETNSVCQALRDAYGLHLKQLKKVVNVNSSRILPMLAVSADSRVGKFVLDAAHPAFVQRKFNGVRALSHMETGDDGKQRVVVYSRSGIEYPGFSDIHEALAPLFATSPFKDIFLDGELYKHGVRLQDISGAARSETPTDVVCEYMIYDCFVPSKPEMPFADRMALLQTILQVNKSELIKAVETFTVASLEEAHTLYRRFLHERYEGAMLRLNEPYRTSENNYHSNVLLKLKPLFDYEYEVVGWETGEKGKAAAALMIVCKVGDTLPADVPVNDVVAKPDATFPVTPSMELAERVELAKKMAMVEPDGKTYFEARWLGKKIIVYYDELSKDGVPLRARTKMETRAD